MKSQESQIAPEKSMTRSNIPGLPYDSEIIQKSIELNLMPSERLLLLLRLRAYMFDKNTKKREGGKRGAGRAKRNWPVKSGFRDDR